MIYDFIYLCLAKINMQELTSNKVTVANVEFDNAFLIYKFVYIVGRVTSRSNLC